MKIEFSSQRKELFLFLATNMAGMTSLSNQQLKALLLYSTICWRPKCQNNLFCWRVNK